MNGLMSKSGTENGTAFSAVASSWRLGSRFSSEWPRWRFGEGRIIAVQLLRVRFWHEAAIRKCPLLRRFVEAKRTLIRSLSPIHDFMSPRPRHFSRDG